MNLRVLILLFLAPAAVAQLTFSEVDFKPVNGESVKADWGELVVPENRSQTSERTLKLAVVRFRSTTAKPRSPIVYLEGGPGVSGINGAFGFLFPVIADLRAVADVIVLDQRGTGRSEPDTKCNARVIDFTGTQLNEPAMRDAAAAGSRKCAEALRAKGIDLSAIQTDENADDLESLRVALHADRLNLLSFSYGTHVAETFSRRHPRSLESVVLVGPALPDTLLKLPSEQDAQVRVIAALAKMPELLATMRRVHAQLDAKPAKFDVADPETKETRPIAVSGFGMQWLVSAMLAKPEMVAALPMFYDATARGDFTILRDATGFLFAPAPRATNFLARCAAVSSAAQQARVGREKANSVLGDAINFPEPGGCKAWPHGTATNQKSFRWPGPTLVVTGTLDANAPPARIEQLRKFFPHRQSLTVDFAGHNDLLGDETVRHELVRFFREGRISKMRSARPRPEFLPRAQ